MLLIKNGEIRTMENENIEKGFVAVDGEGKILKVDEMTKFDLNENEFDQIIDAQGKVVVPGFIDPHCHIGMFEDGMGFEGDDGNEMTDPVTPQLRAIDAINPMDRNFKEALEAGVTSVCTGPGSANVIGGQFVAMKTFGNRVDDMIIKNPLAMKIAFGENPKRVYSDKKVSPNTRMATASILRETLMKAEEYKKKVDQYLSGDEDDSKPPFDFKLESLIPVLEKSIPLKAHCHRADDIFTAIRIAKEFDLDLTLEHCTEGHLIADEILMEQKDVIIGPSLTDRSKIELRNLTFETPGILSKKGVRVAIMTDSPVIPSKYLALCASLAYKEGMGRDEALKAITINAALNNRIDEKVGSIKEGKDGDMVIFDKCPIENPLEKPYKVIINGKVVSG